LLKTEKAEIVKKLNNLVKQYFSFPEEEFIPGQSKVPLMACSFGWEEVSEAMESLLTTWVTMGKKVTEFERLFADYIGMRHGLMVNSGSSANLVALSILTNPLMKNPIKPGDEIIVPACTWSTTIYPIINVNAIPVIVDVNLGTYDIIPDEIEKAITEKTRAIMPVHLLGGSCDMKRIQEIADQHNLYIVEDTCEAYGAEYHGKKVGSFGDISTFSFFLSHHITAIEGGMLLVNNEEMMEIARPLRAHGWIREMKNREKIIAENPNLDSRFLFHNIGFNFRPTEIQGAFGIHQIKKLESFIEIRRNNMRFWNNRLEEFSDYFILHEELPDTKNSSFCFPIIVREYAPFKKEEIMEFLEFKKIETRPIEGANMVSHPAMKHFPYRQVGDLKNSQMILECGFFIGNHQKIGIKEREYIVDCITEFMMKIKLR
jgi:CDP-4-dehydro-6-deoxyglucose reductase, E1